MVILFNGLNKMDYTRAGLITVIIFAVVIVAIVVYNLLKKKSI